ncbi:MAG: T9SS type A sorting domain-containing protein [Saprospiraceae bacterium]|nr:T9SS type A sorting domain-containing protein [Saprospiraceae bacterium]
MPVQLRLSGEGKEELVRLEHSVSGQIFELPVNFIVQKVEFDPFMWLAAKATVVNETISASSDLNSSADIIIYPNPATEMVQIENYNSYFYTYIVTGVDGQNVISGRLSSGINQVDVSGLTTGLYYFHLIGKVRSSHKAIMILN